ncbi:transcription elongation factor GreA, partial [Candidatus Magnetobacterium bavaricum]
IDPAKLKQDTVAFGATVNVFDIDTEEEKQFTLVGADEADARKGRISVTSPVGKALLGKQVGDEVLIKAPAKTIAYEILNISFE